MKNRYFHYTNEKINNQIIFDLLFSIENPLSKIEINKKFYKNIFRLHNRENDAYFSGNIDHIKAYKKLFNTEISFREFYNYYKKFVSLSYIYKSYIHILIKKSSLLLINR